jgi:hypothetical protein
MRPFSSSVRWVEAPGSGKVPRAVTLEAGFMPSAPGPLPTPKRRSVCTRSGRPSDSVDESGTSVLLSPRTNAYGSNLRPKSHGFNRILDSIPSGSPPGGQFGAVAQDRFRARNRRPESAVFGLARGDSTRRIDPATIGRLVSANGRRRAARRSCLPCERVRRLMRNECRGWRLRRRRPSRWESSGTSYHSL